MQDPELNRIAFKLNKNGERSLIKGHPWIFDKSIVKQNRTGKAGDLAIIFNSRSNDVLGVGLYDPESPIRIKVLSNKGPVQVDRDFFRHRVLNALKIRQPLFDTDTDSYRLIFGENDGLPGFIVDVYAKVVVVKLYSAIWFPYLDMLCEILNELVSNTSIVLRLSRILERSRVGSYESGQVISGSLENSRVIFKEHGIRFSANVVEGHKTGYFLDHRHNRKKVGEIARGKNVLDVFSYAGGFSVHALVGGATSVTSLDISEPALDTARYNASLNDYEGKHDTVCKDAFKVMNEFIEQGRQFDIVVVDPPSFAKSKKEIAKARRKYSELAELGSRLVSSGGILLLASCSSRINKEVFLQTNKSVLDGLGRKYRIIMITEHDVDHPISFKEGAYLKCGYYKFE